MGAPMSPMAPQDNGLATSGLGPRDALGKFLPRLSNMPAKTPSIPDGPSDFRKFGEYTSAQAPYDHAYETDFEPLTYIIDAASWKTQQGEPYSAGQRVETGTVLNANDVTISDPRTRPAKKTLIEPTENNSFPIVMCSDAVFRATRTGITAYFTAVCGGKALIKGTHLHEEAADWHVGDRLVWVVDERQDGKPRIWKLKKAPVAWTTYYHAVVNQPLQCSPTASAKSITFQNSWVVVFMTSMF